ncbi:MAG: hypothetical protein KME54_18745 [Tolypothrix brevis GSE-NOS-MK-07-07A]|jgi:predicted metalloprotease|nr:hypothetical protein [Tolypothrix brevis GSE-NOS-MK-07-07A]
MVCNHQVNNELGVDDTVESKNSTTQNNENPVVYEVIAAIFAIIATFSFIKAVNKTTNNTLEKAEGRRNN